MAEAMPPCVVALFVAGGTPRSAAARRNLAATLEAMGRPPAVLRVDIVDVLQQPARALEVGLLATPSLMLTPPAGGRRWFVGDLGRADLLRFWLEDSLELLAGR